MILISHIMEISLDSSCIMLINTLNGHMDVISRDEWDIIQCWQNEENKSRNLERNVVYLMSY